MAYAKFRTTGVVLQPVDAATTIQGELFRDENNADVLTDKSTGGSETPIGAASSDAVLNKLKQNTSGAFIAINTPVALTADGGIITADSDEITTQVLVGIALDAISDGEQGRVALIGPNARGVLAGLGFAPGDAIYLNQNGANQGFTNNPADLTGDNDSFIRIGYADCAPGAASATAEDLIMFAEVIARP